jgi:hypothetical protein
MLCNIKNFNFSDFLRFFFFQTFILRIVILRFFISTTKNIDFPLFSFLFIRRVNNPQIHQPFVSNISIIKLTKLIFINVIINLLPLFNYILFIFSFNYNTRIKYSKNFIFLNRNNICEFQFLNN